MPEKNISAKGKGTPLPRAKIKISDHFNALVKSYTSEQADKATIMQAWLAKRPKPYGVVYHPMYRFSKLSLGVLHLVSFVCAISVVGFIMTLDIGLQAYILSAIAVLFLAICEFGQHSTLNVACNIYHQAGEVPGRIKFIALLFSMVSVVSSAFGTYHFAQTYEVGNNSLVYAILLVSFVNEVLIIYNTIDIHKFEKTCYDESIMINDLTYENGQSTLFASGPPPPTFRTTLIGEHDIPTIKIADKMPPKVQKLNNLVKEKERPPKPKKKTPLRKLRTKQEIHKKYQDCLRKSKESNATYHPRAAAYLQQALEVFDQYQVDGKMKVEYGVNFVNDWHRDQNDEIFK